MLDKVRHVDNDGHDAWECLKCYGRFYASTIHGWKFCPLCGVFWDGRLEWEKPYYPTKHVRNSCSWVVQERSIFKHCDGESFSHWQDTYPIRESAGEGTAAVALRTWQEHLDMVTAHLHEQAKDHETYCGHTGKVEPFTPFAIPQARLVFRKEGHPDKVVLERLEIWKGETK